MYSRKNIKPQKHNNKYIIYCTLSIAYIKTKNLKIVRVSKKYRILK